MKKTIIERMNEAVADAKRLGSRFIVESAIDDAKDEKTYAKGLREFREKYPYPEYVTTWEGMARGDVILQKRYENQRFLQGIAA